MNEITQPTKALYAARIAAVVVIPPFITTMIVGVVAMLTEGERRCFARLDLATPGWICQQSIFDPLIFAGYLLVQVAVLLPIGLWAFRTRERGRWLIGLMIAVGVGLGVRDALFFQETSASDMMYAFIESALPIPLLGIFTALLFPRKRTVLKSV